MKRSLVLAVVVALAAVLPFQLSAEVAIPEPPQECPDLEWVAENIGGELSMWKVGPDEGCDFVFESGRGPFEEPILLVVPAGGSKMTGWDPRPEPEGQKDLLVEGPGSGEFWDGVLWIEPQSATATAEPTVTVPTVTATPTATPEPTAMATAEPTVVPTPGESILFLPVVFNPPLPRLPIPDQPEGCPSIDWLQANVVTGGVWALRKDGCSFDYNSGGNPVMLAVPENALVTGWNPILGENLDKFKGPGHVKVWTAVVWFE